MRRYRKAAEQRDSRIEKGCDAKLRDALRSWNLFIFIEVKLNAGPGMSESTNAVAQVPPQDSPLFSNSAQNVEKPVEISFLGGFFENKSVKWLAAGFLI